MLSLSRLLIGTICFATLAGACRHTSPGGTVRLRQHAAKTKTKIHRLTPTSDDPSPIFELLAQELQVNFDRLRADDIEIPVYYMAYDLASTSSLWLESQDGARTRDSFDKARVLDVDVRVGSPFMDNSRSHDGVYEGKGLGSGAEVSLDDQPLALAQSIWATTESQYQDAVESYTAVESEEIFRSDFENSQHPDFSREKTRTSYLQSPDLDFGQVAQQWREPIDRLSSVLADDPNLLESSVSLEASQEKHFLIDSEGSQIQQGQSRLRISFSAIAQADDGMHVERFKSFDAHQVDQLPDVAELEQAAIALRTEVLALREAPLADPYTGPAVLEGPAAGVFFHEIFGHRLEGHRQKLDSEGQTFRHLLGRSVLPRFLDVVDDPTIAQFNGIPLSGHYFIDDEGIRSRRTELVRAGRLKNFLLGRSPVMPFKHSNGHGRRELGHPIVARQGNLIVHARRAIHENKLRKALLEEVKRQRKPYGLWFKDIQGGYTTTDRGGPQAFKVLPTLVIRIWADGRPDEIVRGVDIVGTPLAAFETIIAAGNKPAVFNGLCGAESGWVPVSAVSPSLLLTKLEVERASHERQRPPLLSPPGTSNTNLATQGGQE